VRPLRITWSPLWLPGIALSLAGVLFALEEPSPERLTNAALGAVGVLLTWVVAVTMRAQYPGRPLAALLFALAAVLASFPALSASSNPTLFTLTLVARPAAELLIVWVMLAFPSGRLPDRLDRLLLGAIAGAIVLLLLPAMAFTPQVPLSGPFMVCLPDCPRNVLFVSARPELAEALILAFRVTVVAGLSGVVLRLGWHLASATPLMRGVLAPVYAVFLVRLASFIAFMATGALGWLPVLLYWAIPLALLYGAMRGRLWIARSLEQLVTRLGHSPTRSDLHALAARALGDASLRIGYRRPGAAGWSDAWGVDLELPAAGDKRRAARFLEVDSGDPAAVLVFDAALLEPPGLLDAVEGSVRMALAVHHLDAALQDTRRQAAVAAALERERIERDLHDSAQQRLIALRLKLAAVQHLQQVEPVRAAALLAEAGPDIDKVLKSLRDLARGLVPALLLEGGLAPALAGLARQAGREVRTRIEPVGRFSGAVEQAVYFCCAEALQNACKHAGGDASVELTLDLIQAGEGGELVFTVQDDGPGFVAPAAGQGLENMRRRVSVLVGRLRIGERSGGGVVVEGTVPLAAPAARP
jgi:signal transduction histidine kinase